MKESEKKEFLIKFSRGGSIAALKKVCHDLIDAEECWFLDSKGVSIEKKKRHIRVSKKYGLVKCSCGKACLLLPVAQGDNIYGYAVLLHLKQEPREKTIELLKSFLDLALKEFQKEQELATLYDTIRPRAIALSTIHTIHRLLSSTLNMDELIERIARLTLQVMRSKHCSIMLLDDSGKYLIPKAVIDLDNNAGNGFKQYHRIRVGNRVEGKVAKTGKVYLSRSLICVPLIEEDIIGVISARDKTNNAAFDKFEMEILATLAEQAVIAIKNAQMYEEQEKMAYGSIKSLAALLDTKSPNTYTHSDQFVRTVIAIAEEMKLSREEIVDLHYAALLPDTGKFSIPEEILQKPSGLSKKEYDIIKKQHLESLKIIEHLDFLKPAIPIIRYHHERYNGTGYPEGLKGKKIPIGARIMAVADAFEAMISARPYKGKRIDAGQAIKEIEHNKGTQFDPDVVDAFITIIQKPEFNKGTMGMHERHKTSF